MQNLLTTVLARAESQHGFCLGGAQNSTGVQRPAALLLTGVINENKFRSLLRQQMPFKDPTVPYGHGEFSHRIQWYCVIKRAQAFDTQGIAWADPYEWVGTQAHTQAQNWDEEGWANDGLWDALFDRNKYGRDGFNGPYNTAALTDFRSPENLHEHLTTHANMKTDCPLLSTFLAVREAKRTNTAIRVSTAYINDYATKKVFGSGVTYAQLSDSDKTQIDTVVAGKTLLPQPTQQQTPDTVMQKLSALFGGLWW
ncbi:LirA/MavJ family T4SS effector [Trinickia soli]|uniref:LirA/MavJ family T4SS effector n=1 Tax=Trinickia soli TaxID=380675 RepID=UPI003FA38666